MLLEMKKNVLVEKPIASSYEDSLHLSKLARELSQKLFVGHIERCNPAIMKLKM